MRLAIVSAMQQELHAVLQRMPDEQVQRAAGRDFWVGHLQGHEVVAVLSRIGKVAAATTATLLIERFGVKRIVFTGVAGGLGQGVAVGDIVVAQSFMQHDLDVSPIFPRYEVPLYSISRFLTDTSLSECLLTAARLVADEPALVTARADVTGGASASRGPGLRFGLGPPQVHHGLIVSGDRFVSSSFEASALQQALPEALAVEMEGAAFAQVCHDYGVPFAAVRTISDRADDAAHVDFLSFIDRVASRYSAAMVGKLLELLPR
jgi:adenosylhomocysteine nucleosidase